MTVASESFISIITCTCTCMHTVHEIQLLLPIPNLRGNHPIACSGKSNPSKRQSHLHLRRCLALRPRGGLKNYSEHVHAEFMKDLILLQKCTQNYVTCTCGWGPSHQTPGGHDCLSAWHNSLKIKKKVLAQHTAIHKQLHVDI